MLLGWLQSLEQLDTGWLRDEVLKGESGQKNEQIIQEILILLATWPILGSENKFYSFVCDCPDFQLSNLPCYWPNNRLGFGREVLHSLHCYILLSASR